MTKDWHTLYQATRATPTARTLQRSITNTILLPCATQYKALATLFMLAYELTGPYRTSFSRN